MLLSIVFGITDETAYEAKDNMQGEAEKEESILVAVAPGSRESSSTLLFPQIDSME